MTNHGASTQGSGWVPSHYARTKLTPQQRAEIRTRYEAGETAQALALEYRVSAATIYANTDRRR